MVGDHPGDGGWLSWDEASLEQEPRDFSYFHYNVNADVDVKPSRVTLACDEIKKSAHKVILKHLSPFLKISTPDINLLISLNIPILDVLINFRIKMLVMGQSLGVIFLGFPLAMYISYIMSNYFSGLNRW